MRQRTRIHADQVAWQPAHEVWPGYVCDGLPDDQPPGEGGIHLKVLRRPAEGAGCWFVLIRFSPPEGHGIRITAVAASDEEVFILSDASGQARPGSFTCNPEGLRHGNSFTGETMALVHYHGSPDKVLKAEAVALQGRGGVA